MPEDNKTESDDDIQNNKRNKGSQRGLWIIIGVGVVALVAVAAVGSFFIVSEKIKFITEFSLTVTLATLVTVQSYIYKKQWQVMSRQSGLISESIKESVKTRELENRPWVNVEGVKLIHAICLPDSRTQLWASVMVSLKNFGTSVAVEVVVSLDAVSKRFASRDWKRAGAIADDQKTAFVFGGEGYYRPVGIVLVPGQVVRLPIDVFSDDITGEEARAGEFCLLGCANYIDQYGNWHRTRFCFRPIRKITDPADVIFEVCSDYQAAD